MDPVHKIEMHDMMAIIHGLKMSGLAFVETDALDAINERIKNLPSSESLSSVYSDKREVQRLCAEVGRIMELIDYYGTRNEESKTRYKAKTKLPPRYKNLKWEKANLNVNIKTAQDPSSQVEAIIQRSKDGVVSIEQVQQQLNLLSNNLNQSVPNLKQYLPPQYQTYFDQLVAIMNSSAQQVFQTTEQAKQDLQNIGETAENTGQVVEKSLEISQQNSQMMGNISNYLSSNSYIENLIKD